MRESIRRRWPLAAIVFLLADDAPRPIDLPADYPFTESVSIGPGGIAYVGSMKGGVARVRLATGKAEPWIRPGAYGSGALFGVLADPRNGLLWTCTNDFTARGVTVRGADAGHFLKGFDLRTGEGRISLPLPGEKPVCNDMAVTSDGSVLVTDTGASRILRWRPGAAALEPWAEDPLFDPEKGGLDGIAFGGDGNIYVNNVRTGQLLRVDVGPDGKAGKVTRLETSRPLAFPDGMRSAGGMDLVLAESSGHVSRVTVNGDRAELHALAEGIPEPTGVDVEGGTVWYVQGRLSHLFDPAKRSQASGLVFRLVPVAASH